MSSLFCLSGPDNRKQLGGERVQFHHPLPAGRDFFDRDLALLELSLAGNHDKRNSASIGVLELVPDAAFGEQGEIDVEILRPQVGRDLG